MRRHDLVFSRVLGLWRLAIVVIRSSSCRGLLEIDDKGEDVLTELLGLLVELE